MNPQTAHRMMQSPTAPAGRASRQTLHRQHLDRQSRAAIEHLIPPPSSAGAPPANPRAGSAPAGGMSSAVTLLAFFILLFALPTLRASTVTGTLVTVTGAAVTNAPVVFQPLSNPQISGGQVITSAKTTTYTDTNGVWSVVLSQGDYNVLLNGRDRFQCSVPNDSATYNISALVTTALTYVYTQPPSYSVLPATKTMTGGVVLATNTAGGIAATIYDTAGVQGQINTFSNALIADMVVPGSGRLIDLTLGGGVLTDGHPASPNYPRHGATGWQNQTNWYVTQIDNGSLNFIGGLSITGQTNLSITAGGQFNLITPNVLSMSASQAQVLTITSLNGGYGGAPIVDFADPATVVAPSLVANTVPYTKSDKTTGSSSVTATELSYLHGVTSSVQSQLNQTTNFAPVVYAADYGPLDVTGATDSTAGVLAAIAAQQTTYNGQCTLIWPAGLIKTYASVTNSKPFRWRGTGSAIYLGSGNTNSYWGTTFLWTGTNGAFITAGGGGGHIEDIALRCSYPLCTNADNTGIYLNGAYNWSFRNVQVNGFGYDWWIDGGAFGNVWNGVTYCPGAYYSQFYVNSAGSPNLIDFLWMQNIQRTGQSDPTATTLTAAVISAGTNITFTYTGSPPYWFTNGMNGYFSGVTVLPSTSAMGSAGGSFGAFLQSVTTTNFVISAPTTITNVALSSASVSESQNYAQAGSMAAFGSGEWLVGILEDEQTICPSPSVSVTSSAKVHFLKRHSENVCMTNAGAVYLTDNSADSLVIDSWEIENEGILAGQTFWCVRDNVTYSTPNQASQPANAKVGILYARDIATGTGATFNFGTTSGSGKAPVLSLYSSSGTIRAVANPTITTWGSKTPFAFNTADNPTGLYVGTPGEQTSYNVAWGLGTPYGAGGSNNVSVGYQAGAAEAASLNVTAVGFQAAKKATSASQLTAIGSLAGNGITSGGTGSTLVGYAAGQYAGSYLTAVGRAAAQNSSGSFNTAVGYGAFFNDNNGYDDTALGYYALNAANSTTNSTAVGANSLKAVTTGNGNTAVGANAGQTITTGANNSILGYAADVDAAARQGTILLGAGATPGADFEFVIGSSGTPILTNTSGVGGSATALPSAPVGYLKVRINGTMRYMPFY